MARIFGVFVLMTLLGGAIPSAARGATAPPVRVLYATDWNGPMQIFARPVTGGRPTSQVTFARPQPCRSAASCGYRDPLPSPDGRWLAYRSAGSLWDQPMLWLARADGSAARAIGRGVDVSWRADSQRLAFAANDGVHSISTTGVEEVLAHAKDVRAVQYAPRGRGLAFIAGGHVMLLQRRQPELIASTFDGGRSSDEWDALAWSPDAKRLAYAATGGIAIRVLTGDQRLVDAPLTYGVEVASIAWSPSGRWLAYALRPTSAFSTAPAGSYGIRVVDTRSLEQRRLTSDFAHDLSWLPDGQTLLYVEGVEWTTGIRTGDVRTVTVRGRLRTVVPATGPFGGEITAVAWTRAVRGTRYRPLEEVDGLFAGGPVQELAADRDRVAFIACKNVTVWTVGTAEVTHVTNNAPCPAPNLSEIVHSVAIAGDHVLWLVKDPGLCTSWELFHTTLGSAPSQLATGRVCLGDPPREGVGTPIGAGGLLVVSAWTLHGYGKNMVVDEQRIERVDPGGCPCPEIARSPGPYTPLDVDGSRVVVSGDNETHVLDRNGTVLLSLRVPTAAAQLSGDDVAVAVGAAVSVYDVPTGRLRATWPLPDAAHHDCDLYGDPSCFKPWPRPRVTIGDFSHGLVSYVFDRRVHVLRVRDGADAVVGYGYSPRFVTAGLVFADEARIRFVAFDRLPVH